jgi:hypothetical protein
MPISMNNTTLTFNDGTTQTTAAVAGGVTSLNGQTGAITNTNLYAIGSYVCGRTQNGTTHAVNSTIAGSSLYSAALGTFWNGTNAWDNYIYGGSFAASLVNTGTWRCTSAAHGSGGTAGSNGLWVRIS